MTNTLDNTIIYRGTTCGQIRSFNQVETNQTGRVTTFDSDRRTIQFVDYVFVRNQCVQCHRFDVAPAFGFGNIVVRHSSLDFQQFLEDSHAHSFGFTDVSSSQRFGHNCTFTSARYVAFSGDIFLVCDNQFSNFSQDSTIVCTCQSFTKLLGVFTTQVEMCHSFVQVENQTIRGQQTINFNGLFSVFDVYTQVIQVTASFQISSSSTTENRELGRFARFNITFDVFTQGHGLLGESGQYLTCKSFEEQRKFVTSRQHLTRVSNNYISHCYLIILSY